MGIIRIGDAAPSLLRLGDVDAYEAYAGDERVWPGNEIRLWLHLTSSKDVNIFWEYLTADTSTTVNWGDGQATTYPEPTAGASHSYAGPGDYCIRIRPQATERVTFGYGLYYNNIFGVGAGGTKSGTSPELVRMEIGGLVNTINNYSFAGCTSLRAVTAPESVLSIGDETFKGCAGLVLAEIGAQRLGADVLKSCPRLQKLWLRENVEAIVADTLRDIGPTGALTIYCEANEKPASWPEGWNPGGFPVTWGQKARPW